MPQWLRLPAQAARSDLMKHDDYPHEPGRLPGCAACDEKCHCGPDVYAGREVQCIWPGHDVQPSVCQHDGTLALELNGGEIIVRWQSTLGLYAPGPEPGVFSFDWLRCLNCGTKIEVEPQHVFLDPSKFIHRGLLD